MFKQKSFWKKGVNEEKGILHLFLDTSLSHCEIIFIVMNPLGALPSSLELHKSNNTNHLLIFTSLMLSAFQKHFEETLNTHVTFISYFHVFHSIFESSASHVSPTFQNFSPQTKSNFTFSLKLPPPPSLPILFNFSETYPLHLNLFCFQPHSLLQ